VAVKSKYFSGRAFVLHFVLLCWLAMSAVAAWWQVGRAVQGNSLSFLYAIEWPVIGVLGVLGWYALLNLEKVTARQEQERREYEERMRAQARAARDASEQAEDPAMAAYNDHLAELSTKPKKKLWGH
jgi:DNA-binding transcriptional regulator of glucitol operon